MPFWRVVKGGALKKIKPLFQAVFTLRVFGGDLFQNLFFSHKPNLFFRACERRVERFAPELFAARREEADDFIEFAPLAFVSGDGEGKLISRKLAEKKAPAVCEEHLFRTVGDGAALIDALESARRPVVELLDGVVAEDEKGRRPALAIGEPALEPL